MPAAAHLLAACSGGGGICFGFVQASCYSTAAAWEFFGTVLQSSSFAWKTLAECSENIIQLV